MTNEAEGDRLGNIPRYAIFRDRKVRIVDYEAGRFRIIDTDDSSRTVVRSQLTFIK